MPFRALASFSKYKRNSERNAQILNAHSTVGIEDRATALAVPVVVVVSSSSSTVVVIGQQTCTRISLKLQPILAWAS
jgi:hypothetical protein